MLVRDLLAQLEALDPDMRVVTPTIQAGTAYLVEVSETDVRNVDQIQEGIFAAAGPRGTPVFVIF